MSQPYVDHIALEEAEKAGNINNAGCAWLSRLGHAKMMLRQVSTGKMFVSIGYSLSDVVWCWPVRRLKACPDLYEPSYKDTDHQVLRSLSWNFVVRSFGPRDGAQFSRVRWATVRTECADVCIRKCAYQVSSYATY